MTYAKALVLVYILVGHGNLVRMFFGARGKKIPQDANLSGKKANCWSFYDLDLYL